MSLLARTTLHSDSEHKVLNKHKCVIQEVGKVTFKSNGEEALSDEFLLKSNGDEALNDDFP
jgi:hypothetical protein